MIQTGSSHLSKIGSGLPQAINSLSKEIHAKRFLKNKYVNIEVHYMPYLKQFMLGMLHKKGKISNNNDIYVVIDGSQTGSKHVTLMLSVVVGNRSIPLFWVVREGKKGHFPTEMHLDVVENGIKMLQQILDSIQIQAKICILGDGEFDSTELQMLCQNTLKINYVFRTASNAVLYDQGDKFSPYFIHQTKVLVGEDNSFFIPNVAFSKQKLENINFLYWFDESKYKEPLYLISNLDCALDIQYAYAIRFRIELMFKDLKSRGFNLDDNRLGSPLAVRNLIIVAALSFCILLNFGFENEDNSLKIKVQRIDKKINSIFSFAILLLKYLLEQQMSFSLIPNHFFVSNSS